MTRPLIWNIGPWSNSEDRLALSVIDQNGKKVGEAYKTPAEVLRVDAYVDDNGTVWTPPTAYAYAMVCKARDTLSEQVSA